RRLAAARHHARRLRRALARARRVGAHPPRARRLRGQRERGCAEARRASPLVAAEATEGGAEVSTHLSWLIKLRWGAVLTQAILVLAVDRTTVSLPIVPL